MDEHLKKQIEALFIVNERTHRGRRYTVPSIDTYPYQWFWDSCFHAITLSYIDTDRALDELELLAASQLRSGMMPHIIYWNRDAPTTFPSIKWGTRTTSSITQPPVLAAALWRLYEATGDTAMIERLLPHIHAFHRYLLNERDPLGINLAAIVNPDESGEDNSPRFDAVLKLTRPHHRFSSNFRSRLALVDDWRQARFRVKELLDQDQWIYDISFNCILVESLRLTALLAAEVSSQQIERYSLTQAEAVKTAIRSHLLKRGKFRSAMGPKLKPLRHETWATFMPLYAGVVNDDEARIIVTDYLNDPHRYKTPYSVPTVPMNDNAFNPNGDWMTDGSGTNWRGPVWIGANWFVVQGLLRYGYRREARRLYHSSVQLIKQAGLREYYDPITGEGHGARGFTWGGLVLDMQELITRQK